MPKKNKVVGAIKAVRKVAARAKRPVPRRNSGGGVVSDVVAETQQALIPVAAGATSYIVARLLGRLLRVYLGPKIMNGVLQKHFGPAGNAAALVAAIYGGKRVNALRAYRQELIVGAGIAFFQSLIETYLPGLSGIVDANPQLVAPTPKVGLAGTAAAIRPRGRTRYVVPGQLESEAANQRIAHAQSENIYSEAQVVDDEYPQSPVGDSGDGLGEYDVIDEIVSQGDDADLYEGVFAN
jgi:hypothetical protein